MISKRNVQVHPWLIDDITEKRQSLSPQGNVQVHPWLIDDVTEHRESLLRITSMALISCLLTMSITLSVIRHYSYNQYHQLR